MKLGFCSSVSYSFSINLTKTKLGKVLITVLKQTADKIPENYYQSVYGSRLTTA